MRVGLVTPYFPDSKTINSGLANHFAILAEGLEELENDVIVIHVRPRYDHETDWFEKREINKRTTVLTYKVALPGWLYNLIKSKWSYIDVLLKLRCLQITAAKLNGIRKAYKLDVIETTSYFSLCYFYLLTNPRTTIVTRVSTTFLQMMDDYYPYKSRLSKWFGGLEIKTIKKSKNLVTHATSHARELELQYHITAEKFKIIPHGIRLPRKSDLTATKNQSATILYVGRFEYRKGTDVLMQAIPIVFRNLPDVVFELVGIDPDNRYQKQFIKENSTEVIEKVFFRGGLNDENLKKAYASCDIFAAPSRYESFGLIYIEAMSYGKPVIGCKVGGVQDIISDGFNGLFAETGDADSLAKKIILLASDLDRAKNMGANARETAKEKFSKETLALDSLAYYRDCLFNPRAL